MLIEQAIFTSAQTDCATGYQLVAASPGVRDVDAQQLANWGPSHDSLWEEGPDGSSVNFFRLPSGAYCVSRTTPAGSEYSGRRGPRIYTQCLVVEAELLARFANNPFALLRAAVAQGSLRVYDQVPERLQPIRLVGRAAAFDHALLSQLTKNPGIEWLATLIQAALEQPIGLVGGGHNQRLLAGLLNCLPPECRGEMEFATGLRYSPRRPFRIVCLPDDPAERRRLERRYGLAVLHVAGPPPAQFAPRDGWARLIADVLSRRKGAWLASQLAHARPQLQLQDLDGLGRRLLSDLGQTQSDPDMVTLQTPLALNLQWLNRIANDLNRLPDDEGVWNTWRLAHQESLERGDEQRASNLVLRACEILGGQPDGVARYERRIGELLVQQLELSPSLLRRTAESLGALPEESQRDHWQHLALRIAQGSRQRKVNTHGAHATDAAENSVDDDNADLGPARPLRLVASDEEVVNSSARRADAPHRHVAREQLAAVGSSALETLEMTPADVLGPQCPQAQALLEELDDAVFEAVAGKSSALASLRQLWPQTLAALGPELLRESKEQYLRHALGVWRHCLEGDELRNPQLAMSVLDVLDVLYLGD